MKLLEVQVKPRPSSVLLAAAPCARAAFVSGKPNQEGLVFPVSGPLQVVIQRVVLSRVFLSQHPALRSTGLSGE